AATAGLRPDHASPACRRAASPLRTSRRLTTGLGVASSDPTRSPGGVCLEYTIGVFGKTASRFSLQPSVRERLHDDPSAVHPDGDGISDRDSGAGRPDDSLLGLRNALW